MSSLTPAACVFGALAVAASVYVALSRDLLRVSIAFFVEIAAAGGILLTLNADYLALTVLAVGLFGTVVIISFSSGIMGSLKEAFVHEAASGGHWASRLLGMLVGLVLGAAICRAFLSIPLLDLGRQTPLPSASKDVDVYVLGRMMLGDQFVVFELLAVVVLLVVIGTSLLLRKSDDGN